MTFENSWSAVFNPDLATDYFVRHAHRPFAPILTGYDSLNAWWLAELSRLIYRRESDEIGAQPPGPTRGDVLASVGLRETAFFNHGGSQAALVEPAAATAAPFAAIIFRGSDDMQAWFDFNLGLVPVPWEQGGTVHHGFLEALDAIWNPILDALEALRDDTPVIYAGHSLGGAMATLAASRRLPALTYTFGSPRVGDAAFGATVPRKGFFRIVNNRDIVTDVPVGLAHVGELHYITHNGQIRVDPDSAVVFRDRLKRDWSFELKRNLLEVITGPPQ
jgi:pimeloyl-ACP methyl ester carboxylesterase